MFTGIVQGLGEIIAIEQPSVDFRTHIVRLPEHMAHDLQTGASIAHNGCCLTVTKFTGHIAHFDLMQETLAKTNLGSLKAGDGVNLERAARFGDEIGGHVMSGHIIGQTEIIDIFADQYNKTLTFRLPENLQAYVLPKGFIGLDGCSLTIGEVGKDFFQVHLIPETLQRTLFGTRIIGDQINIEIDAQTQAIVDTVTRLLNTNHSK